MKVRPDIDELFERRIVYPDFEPEERLAALVGLEEHKRRLTNILALLVNTDRLEGSVAKSGYLVTCLRDLPRGG